jgi:serine protease Do
MLVRMRMMSVRGRPFSFTLVLASLAFAAGCQKPVATAANAPPQEPAKVVIASAAPPFAMPPVAPHSLDVPLLASKLRPAVVNVLVEHAPVSFEGMPNMPGPFGELFRKWQEQHGKGKRMPMPMPRSESQGSGFIVNAQGGVVTNAHVVAGATQVKVRLSDGREFKATVKGKDRKLDLAFLEVEGAKDLPSTVLGASGPLQVGETVIAIGNPFGLGHTVTLGIVSAKGRAIGAGPYDDFIQTDASINPGNSGGPLFNARGEVIGINTAINPNGRGIGFAIPVDVLKEVLPQLATKGSVSRGKIGVVIQAIDDHIAKAMKLSSTKGALVSEVASGDAGDKAGLKSGDVILSVDGTLVEESKDLPRLVAKNAPGTKIKLQVLRDGKTRAVDLTLSEMKDEPEDDDGEEDDDEDEMPNPHHGKGMPRGPNGKPGPKDPTSKEAPPKAPRLGAMLKDANGGGAEVGKVLPGSPAGAVLAPSDVIQEVDGKPVKTAAEAVKAIEAHAAGTPMLLKVKREGKVRFLTVDLAKRVPGRSE